MSLLGDIEGLFSKAKADISALVPASLKADLGAFAHTFVANVLHDAGAEAKSVGLPLIESVWNTIKTQGISLATEYLAGGSGTFEDVITKGVSMLKSDVATQLVPGLKVVGQDTLNTALRTAVSTALAVGSGNPTSTAASSSVGPSPASSKA